MTYAVVSDLHCFKWSVYSSVNTDGVNSRLRIILDELKRAAQTLLDAGGSQLVVAGDIFHVRGAIDPEVLNPTQAAFRDIMDMGIEILMIPGNHDLAGKETTALGSSIQTLAETFSMEGSIEVYNKPQLVFGNQPKAFIPWCSTVDKMLVEAGKLAKLAASDLPDFDLFIHAGIDGVLNNTPDHGLTAKRLAELGFRNVFAGHYHNHKDMSGGIWSIGATTHQTWSDIDTKAGFLIVHDSGQIEFHDSHAPKFIDIAGMDEEEIQLVADGNYLRLRGSAMKLEEVAELRDFLKKAGALGVSIQVVRETATARPTASASGRTLQESVAGFIDSSKAIPGHLDKAEIKRRALDVLSTASSVFEET